MSLARIIPFDRRSEQVAVSRAALSAASENAAAASQSVQDAVDRALGHVWAGNRAGVVRELERIGFETAERLPQLLILTKLSEEAPALVDGSWKPAKSGSAA